MPRSVWQYPSVLQRLVSTMELERALTSVSTGVGTAYLYLVRSNMRKMKGVMVIFNNQLKEELRLYKEINNTNATGLHYFGEPCSDNVLILGD